MKIFCISVWGLLLGEFSIKLYRRYRTVKRADLLFRISLRVNVDGNLVFGRSVIVHASKYFFVVSGKHYNHSI